MSISDSPYVFVCSSPLKCATSIIAFIMGVLVLVTPSGYSIGPGLLFLVSLIFFFKHSSFNLSKRDYWIIAALGVYGLVVGVMSMIELGYQGFDKPRRYLLAIPVLLLILHYPPSLRFLWAGLAVGTISAGSVAIWMKLAQDIDRVGVFIHPIQFGNLNLLMGVLCSAGLGWAAVQRHRGAWLAILLLGLFLGMLGSLMSGSRGGWVGLPIIGFIVYLSYGRQLPIKIKFAAISGILVFLALVYSLPQTGVQQRIEAGISDVSNYISGAEKDTSLGLRFEMWQGASQLISDKPFLGWGEAGYYEAMVNLSQQGVITPKVAEFTHAHNEFIDAFAKRGIVGLMLLLALFLIPIRMFSANLFHDDLQVRSMALAGTLLPVSFIGFGLSQVSFAHNSGVMFYAFWLAVLWGCYSELLRRKISISSARLASHE